MDQPKVLLFSSLNRQAETFVSQEIECGITSSISVSPRILQFALKYNF